MASRPTVSILGADGKPGSQTYPLPNVFRAPIRPDIVQYVGKLAVVETTHTIKLKSTC